MDDAFPFCLEHAQSAYRHRLSDKLHAQTMTCQSLIPSFLSMVKERVTEDALMKGNGAVFLPIQSGCFATFAQALADTGKVKVVESASGNSTNCSCMLMMSMNDGMVVTPSFLSAGCDKKE